MEGLSLALSPSRSGVPLADMTLSVTWIGTATVLLRYGGFTVLTDPNFLHRGVGDYPARGS